ncbi:DUF116 domain-containing protein [candidate division KSB1 bacterium]|nr:DUF116 domain-containing protein [candidate division KSB1 bacterium]MBL7095711.1 DUF116 domain-containing protein [candidate division KSB1 bacterium]
MNPGKTYSLYANADTSNEYYETIRKLIDRFLENCRDEKILLLQVRKAISKPGLFKIFHNKFKNNCFEDDILKSSLSKFTKNIKNHLEEISIIKRFDPIIGTTEKQYFLYMLEIELVNRIYKKEFNEAHYKIALLPHCLRDFHERCLSQPGEIEQTCKGCNKDCFINQGSKILKKYQIDPYISVTIDQAKMFKYLMRKHKSISALGIACIPELVRGMRMCLDFDIPAIGIPLDVNRCARWMGRAQETSFNIEALENLIR